MDYVRSYKIILYYGSQAIRQCPDEWQYRILWQFFCELLFTKIGVSKRSIITYILLVKKKRLRIMAKNKKISKTLLLKTLLRKMNVCVMNELLVQITAWRFAHAPFRIRRSIRESRSTLTRILNKLLSYTKIKNLGLFRKFYILKGWQNT